VGSTVGFPGVNYSILLFLAAGLPVAADDNKDPCVDSKPLSLGSSPQQSTVSVWRRRAMTHYHCRLGSKYFTATRPFHMYSPRLFCHENFSADIVHHTQQKIPTPIIIFLLGNNRTTTVTVLHQNLRPVHRQELVDFRLNVRHDGFEPVSIWNR